MTFVISCKWGSLWGVSCQIDKSIRVFNACDTFGISFFLFFLVFYFILFMRFVALFFLFSKRILTRDSCKFLCHDRFYAIILCHVFKSNYR